ncbi:MAG TPA: glycosyltransferase family 4 protein [Candidatus Acidoferrum sp.]|nr:glycosyltransferase family 4 protein [Candidatus Acidoferrum sp.]
MTEGRFRVLVVASHPVQYMAPVLRRMASHPRLDLRVAYCSLRGAEAVVDPDFGTEVKWDVPLLDGYEWTHVPNKGPERDSFWGMNNPGLKGMIFDGKFDAVICFTGYVRASFWIARRAAKKAGAAFIFGTDASSLEPRDGKAWKIAFKKIVWPRLFGLADQVVVPSSASEAMMRALGIPAEKITMTPYSVDNAWWMEQAGRVDREAEREKFGLRDEDTAILFCAKLQPWKRPMDLLRAYAQAQQENSRLIFAGDGPLKAELEAEAARLGVADQVVFSGFVNQSALPALYKLVDLMVLPSSYEPFAVVVNEAMCCGCPVMVSDRVGAARDLVEPVAPDLVFPVGNVQLLADKLARVLRNPEVLRKLRPIVVEHIKTWSPERNIEAMIAAIEAGVGRVRGS